MKRFISAMLILNILGSLFIYVAKATEETVGYFDTAPKAIPENLITSGMAIDGQNTAHIKRNASISGQEMYTVAEIPEDEVNNIWYVFGGASIAAILNGGKYLNLNNYEAGTTYVYQAKVKNTSEDSSLVPYYGIANTNNKHGYKNAVGSNIYGKTGMAVTSTEWVNFRDTITYSDSWDETKTGYLGQTLIQGIATTGTPVGASLAVMKNAVDAGVLNSLEDDSLYLAEEIAYDIKIYPEKDLGFGEELRLVQNGSLKLSAEVVNQLEITGTLDQAVKWVIVTEDRKTVIKNVTSTVEGNSVTLSCDETLSEGRYAAVAISEKYGIVKGIEFDVVKDLSEIYKNFEAEESTGNLIQNPSNSSFATASSDNVNVSAGDGYVTIEALNDIESELGVEGLRVRNVGSNGLSSSFNFEAGKSYIIKARVRNPEPENNVYFNASISNSTKDTLSLTTEYGSQGMLLTGEWQEFSGSIKVSENYDNDAAIKNRNFTLGLSSGTKKGAKADIELSVYAEEEKVFEFTNEVINGDTVLREDKTLTLKAGMKNQFNLKGSLPDDFEWIVLNSSKTVKCEEFAFAKNDGGTVTVSVTDNTPVGEYVIAAYSEGYGVTNWIDVTVKHEKYVVYVSPDGNDRAKGSSLEPLSSLGGAKAFIRKKIAEGVFDYYSGIDVVFSPGEYVIENTVNFTNADSGTESNSICYKANGNVIFKGSMDFDLNEAKTVTDSEVLKKLDESVRTKVIELDISEYPHDLSECVLRATSGNIINDGSEYPEVYLNGVEQNLAQWPNGDGEFSKYEYVAANQFSYTDDEPSKWTDAKNWWIGGYPNRDYDYRRMPGVAVDAENKIITVETDSDSGTKILDADNKSKRWKAYNLLEELDEVGEWYIDAENKKLYYYPPKLSESDTLEISFFTGNMITMKETQYVNFEGFSFEKSRGGVFSTTDIKNITISNCYFSDCSKNAFYNTGSESAQTDKDYWQRQKINGAYNCIIENCVFNNIGGYAIHIFGGNVDTLEPGNNIIRNNFFYKCSQKVRGYPAIYLRGCGNTFEKNNISNLPFQAVNLSGNDHIIRYNEIYDVCRETEDCAAIYQGRNSVQRGTVVEYNYLHDLYPLYTYTEDRTINAAVYWDDSQSGMTVKNNIIRNAKLGIFNNNGVDNNFSANTIIDTYRAIRVKVTGAAQNANDTSGITGFAGYIENPELYYEKYDNLKTILETDPINSGTTGKELGRFNIIKDNLIVNTEGVEFSEYCGVVDNDTVEECNDFVNPDKQDYRIKLNSETYEKNGEVLNENFDIELIGANEENFLLEKDFELYYPYGKISEAQIIRFQWSEALGATYYRLEISKNSEFSDLIYSDMVTYNYTDVPGIEKSTDKYYWRVTAINSSRNMPEEWVSETGEFYCGRISVDNISIVSTEAEFEINADIKNEFYEDVPAAQVYAAGYSEEGKLINVYKYDISFDSSDYEFSKTLAKNEEVSYIRLFLWDGMIPLTENAIKTNITKAEL